jgi:hypothetical protein
MIKVGITLEGDVEELVSVLQYISDRQGEGFALRKPATVEPDGTDEEIQTWTEEKIKSILYKVSFNCESLLKEIAKHENGIGTFALGKKLGVEERGVGGILSSLGRQLKDSEFEGLPYPLEYTYEGGYKMPPIWRDTIAKIEAE